MGWKHQWCSHSRHHGKCYLPTRIPSSVRFLSLASLTFVILKSQHLVACFRITCKSSLSRWLLLTLQEFSWFLLALRKSSNPGVSLSPLQNQQQLPSTFLPQSVLRVPEQLEGSSSAGVPSAPGQQLQFQVVVSQCLIFCGYVTVFLQNPFSRSCGSVATSSCLLAAWSCCLRFAPFVPSQKRKRK